MRSIFYGRHDGAYPKPTNIENLPKLSWKDLHFSPTVNVDDTWRPVKKYITRKRNKFIMKNTTL